MGCHESVPHQMIYDAMPSISHTQDNVPESSGKWWNGARIVCGILRWPWVSSPDKRIWQQKLEGWIHRTVPDQYHIDEKEGQRTLEEIKVVLQPQIDLMEALFVHGMLTENDLRLLPPVSLTGTSSPFDPNEAYGAA